MQVETTALPGLPASTPAVAQAVMAAGPAATAPVVISQTNVPVVADTVDGKPQQTPEQKKKAEESKKAVAWSRNMFIAAVTASGAASWGMRTWLGATWAAAFNPSVQAAFDVAKAPGARFNEQWTNPLQALVFRVTKSDSIDGKEKVDNGPSKLLYPKLQEDLINAYVRRSAKDNRVTAQTDTVVTYTTQMEFVCASVKARLGEGDLNTAARLLASAFVHDRQIWFEYNPANKFEFQVILLRLYPYMRALPADQREAFTAQVKAEALRLAPEDKTFPVYTDGMMQGLTTDPKLTRTAQADVSKFAPPEVMQKVGLEFLTLSAANSDGGNDGLKSIIEKRFEELYKGKGIFARISAVRVRRRVTKAVTKELEAFEKAAGRKATLEELLRMVMQAFDLDAAGALERRVTLVSGGAFAAMGAVTGLATAGINSIMPSPAIRAAANPVIYALVGYAMGASGSFINTKFGSWSRSVGFRAAKQQESIGPRNERDLLNQLLRTLAVDGRMGGVRASLCMYQMGLHPIVMDAEVCIRENDLEGAAEHLADVTAFGSMNFAEFSPYGELMQLTFTKLGPHFDCLTDKQRDELLALCEARLKPAVSAEALQGYCMPFLQGMLRQNVIVKA